MSTLRYREGFGVVRNSVGSRRLRKSWNRFEGGSKKGKSRAVTFGYLLLPDIGVSCAMWNEEPAAVAGAGSKMMD
jgi:hypothetical protein